MGEGTAVLLAAVCVGPPLPKATEMATADLGRKGDELPVLCCWGSHSSLDASTSAFAKWKREARNLQLLQGPAACRPGAVKIIWDFQSKGGRCPVHTRIQLDLGT